MKKLILCIFLSGCMVGPTYHKPDDAMPESFLEDKEQETAFVSDPELIEWWKEFHDPFLNELLEEAFKSNFQKYRTLHPTRFPQMQWDLPLRFVEDSG